MVEVCLQAGYTTYDVIKELVHKFASVSQNSLQTDTSSKVQEKTNVCVCKVDKES